MLCMMALIHKTFKFDLNLNTIHGITSFFKIIYFFISLMLKSKSSYIRAELFELMLILVFIHTLESLIGRGANAREGEGGDTSTALSRVCVI